ncbi:MULTISPECIES: ATP-binding protein [unclassified Sphingobium]|uniref:ATP-binding protein n=1 Tax=unclassified Sphingobium TaxID=2611147 RepID=UPI0022248A41|nr:MULTISPECIES: ATP-binding protein [unclassified Sphingobium]MCW2411367.1 putative ATPase [Sphingobium sp. B8D3D]MCW2416341.1 putative ATPase [Sphingobium sp. B8D3A]
MKFKFVTLTASEAIPMTASNVVVLGYDSWDDWFEFETTYNVVLFDEAGERHHLGGIKIGEAGQTNRRASVPREFDTLPPQFFSVGLTEDYYKSLSDLGFASDILPNLNDMAYNLEILEKSKDERVTARSLFRTVDSDRIKNKFHRLANGNAELTSYAFEYIVDDTVAEEEGSVLRFEVQPNSKPPSNVHTLIGRNGVGKTTCLNNIARAYVDSLIAGSPSGIASEKVRLRVYSDSGGGAFANLISVTFSAFDPFFTESRETKGRYSYIGLKESLVNFDKVSAPAGISYRVKNPDDLNLDFIKSAEKCLAPPKRARWMACLENLASDPIFAESDIIEITDNFDDSESWKEFSSSVFRRLSSGHKIVLLTITRLVELVEEQSLVLLDEPESHLHPPLLSAFIRTLSELLTAQNGVAIVATHSPVVLQETPKDCAWILDRSGNTARARRPLPETFGENVGRLTHEVFGLEVTETGFYELLREAADRLKDFSAVEAEFGGRLGSEARSILHALLAPQKARVR